MKSVLAHLLFAAALLSYARADNHEDEVDEASVFRGMTPMSSWGNQSPNNNPWTGTSTAGAAVGFIVFGLSYIYVVVYIFFDINRSKNEYAEMVEEDKNIINNLNVPPNMREEWERDLALRLEGKSGEDKLDDQLFGAAATLQPAEFQKFM